MRAPSVFDPAMFVMFRGTVAAYMLGHDARNRLFSTATLPLISANVKYSRIFGAKLSSFAKKRLATLAFESSVARDFDSEAPITI